MASVIVISGAAGSGKGTLVKMVTKNNDSFFVSRSVTTREIRKDDVPGVTYDFIDTHEEFLEMVRNNVFVEYNKYNGHYYGTRWASVRQALSENKNMILEIDVNGALNVKKEFPEAILIWITPPDYENLERRLRGRGTNTESDMLDRLERSKKELENLKDYDYLIINRDGEAEKAADTIRAIIAFEEAKRGNCENTISDEVNNLVNAALVKNNSDFTDKFYKTSK